MPGSDFASAELIDAWEIVDEFLPGSTGEHYYRFTISNATNQVFIVSKEYDESVAPSCEVEVYDSTETLYAASNNNGESNNAAHTLVNIPTGTYYLSVFDSGGTQDLKYMMSVYIIENGVYPAILHTDDVEVDVDAEDPFHIINEIDADLVEFEDALAPQYENFQAHVFDPTPCAATKNVTSYKSNNPMVIDGMLNNRVIGNQAIAQYSIKGVIRKDGVAFGFAKVRLYDRTSGELIESTTADNLGAYAFRARVNPDFKYFVVAHDTFDNPVLQAVTHDYLDPILETL